MEREPLTAGRAHPAALRQHELAGAAGTRPAGSGGLLPALPSVHRPDGRQGQPDGPVYRDHGLLRQHHQCDPAHPAGPFEVRYGTHRFRLTTVHGVSCANYLNVTTPAAGFDRQTGTGTGTLDGVAGAYFEWTFVDGGPGGVPDSAALTIRVAGSPPQFQSYARGKVGLRSPTRRASSQAPRNDRLQHRPGAGGATATAR